MVMSANYKKSMGWAILLIMLGLLAMISGTKWLGLLIPAAAWVWYEARPILRRSKN